MPKLIQQVRDQAIDSAVPVGDVLRRASVLASRLGDAEFERWVSLELNGYPIDGEFPSYRMMQNPQVKGHFFGVAGMQMKNAEISSAAVPKQLRDAFDFIRLAIPAPTYEELLREAAAHGYIRVPWPADVLGYIDQFDMACLSAWYVVPTSRIRSLLGTVRNKILSYSLEIEKESPDAGDAVSARLPPEFLHQVFTNNITGDVGNIAQGGTNVSQVATFAVTPGDFASLERVLKSQGVQELDLVELKRAVDAEPPSHDRGEIGPSVGAWIGKNAVRIATATAAGLIVRAIAAFYGF